MLAAAKTNHKHQEAKNKNVRLFVARTKHLANRNVANATPHVANRREFNLAQGLAKDQDQDQDTLHSARNRQKIS